MAQQYPIQNFKFPNHTCPEYSTANSRDRWLIKHHHETLNNIIQENLHNICHAVKNPYSKYNF